MASFDNLGFNLRLSDIQAAVGVAQMAKLERLLAERRRLGRRYTELLADCKDVICPVGGDREGHAYQSYVIRIPEGGRKRRNAAMAALAEFKIQTRPGTHAVHRLGYYQKKYGLRAGQYPNAVLAEDTTITLPVFPGMTEADQSFVVATLRKSLQG